MIEVESHPPQSKQTARASASPAEQPTEMHRIRGQCRKPLSSATLRILPPHCAELCIRGAAELQQTRCFPSLPFLSFRFRFHLGSRSLGRTARTIITGGLSQVAALSPLHLLQQQLDPLGHLFSPSSPSTPISPLASASLNLPSPSSPSSSSSS